MKKNQHRSGVWPHAGLGPALRSLSGVVVSDPCWCAMIGFAVAEDGHQSGEFIHSNLKFELPRPPNLCSNQHSGNISNFNFKFEVCKLQFEVCKLREV